VNRQVVYPDRTLKTGWIIGAILVWSLLLNAVSATAAFTLAGRSGGLAVTPDPFRSYASLFYQLTTSDEIYIWQNNEWPLYRDLLLRSYRPTHLILEWTFYPLATGAAWFEEQHPPLFRRFDLGGDFNLLKSLGGGRQEPFSVSLFTGQIAAFLTLDTDDELRIAARGIAGPVLTCGWWQLFDNQLVRSNWYRIEWKIKGQGRTTTHRHEWDIKSGYRCFGLRGLPNVVSIALSRSHFEKGSPGWGLWHNSLMESQIEAPLTHFRRAPSRLSVHYGKMIPWRKRLIGLKAGLVYENRPSYDSLTAGFTQSYRKTWTFHFQPMIWF